MATANYVIMVVPGHITTQKFTKKISLILANTSVINWQDPTCTTDNPNHLVLDNINTKVG